MTKANELLNEISSEIQKLQAESQSEVLMLIEQKLSAVKAIPSFDEVSDNLRHQIVLIFDILSQKAKEERYIGNLKAMNSDISKAYENSLKSINEWLEEQAAKKITTNPDPEEEAKDDKPEKVKKPVKTFVQKSVAMNVHFDKVMLETEADVEAYLNEVKNKMLEYIHQNKNIMLN